MKLVLSSLQEFKEYGIPGEIAFSCPIGVKDQKKEGAKGERYFEGYATTETKDRVNDIVTFEAMHKAKDDLLKNGSKTVFLNHDVDKPIGSVRKTLVDVKGLLIGVKISNAKDVDDIWTKIKEGTLNSLSIRLKYEKIEIEKDDVGRPVACRILQMKLLEVSVVGLPCNPDASITSVVEKSFRKLFARKSLMSNTDSQRRSRKMKKNGSEKASTHDIVAELLPGMLQEALTKALPDVMKGMMTKQEEKTEAKEEVKTTETKAEEKKEEKKEETKEGGDKFAEAIALLTTKIEAMFAKKEDTKGAKKSVASDEEKEDEGQKDFTKKPEFFDTNDEHTIKWCVHMWKHQPSQYTSLKADEKEVAKRIYFAMIPYIKGTDEE